MKRLTKCPDCNNVLEKESGINPATYECLNCGCIIENEFRSREKGYDTYSKVIYHESLNILEDDFSVLED